MKILILFTLTLSLPTYAQEMCQAPGIASLIKQVSELSSCLGPEMDYRYSLSKDCSYSVQSTVVIPSDIPSAMDFMFQKVTNPRINFASADKNDVAAYTLNGNQQVITAKKKGQKVNLYSTCTQSGNAQQASFKCVLDVNRSKFKKIISIQLFERNETVITCKTLNKYAKECTFRTVGKAKSIPLLGSACELAPKGAAETFSAVYRLSHYLTHGNVNDISRGDRMVSDFNRKVAANPHVVSGSAPK